MSQKSSLPQPTQSVSRVLTADTLMHPAASSLRCLYAERAACTRLVLNNNGDDRPGIPREGGRLYRACRPD